MALPDWFEEMIDDAREFEDSGEFDRWLQEVGASDNEELKEKLNLMGL